MRSKTKVVSLKLTQEEFKELEDLVVRGKFPSVSAAIRAGLDTVFEKFVSDPRRLGDIASARRVHPGRQGKVRRPQLGNSPPPLQVLPSGSPKPEPKTLVESLAEVVYSATPPFLRVANRKRDVIFNCGKCRATFWNRDNCPSCRTRLSPPDFTRFVEWQSHAAVADALPAPDKKPKQSRRTGS